jgi:hypothetical protein
MVGNKYDRQMDMQRMAVDVIRRDPSLLSDPRLQVRLKVISENTHGELYRRVLNTWSRLLRDGDVDEISRVVLANTESGGYMRTTSPLGVLLLSEQRHAVMRGDVFTAV